MRGVKSVLPLLLLLAFVFSGCNTIENRRSLYKRKEADGPYTRSLEDGSWKKRQTVDQEYAEQQRRKAGPQLRTQEAVPAAGGEAL